MEQHPHTLHSIWAGSIAVGDLSCGEPRLSLLCLLEGQEFMISAPAQVCLRDGAKDECNVVEIVGRNHKNQEITVPVANLKLSCQPLVRGCFEGSGGGAAGNWISLDVCGPFPRILTISWSAAHREMPWVALAWLQMPSEGHV